jgi:GNAT superfamily N-acetyltransferase
VFIEPVEQAAGTLQQIALDAALLPQAQALSDEAGWNQNAADWQIFQRHGEVFGVLTGERLVATAAILPYGADFAWISMVLVTAEFRRLGLAKRLMQRCMARLRAQRRAALLDATEAGEPVYRALGFTTLTRMTRWADANQTPPPLVGLGREAQQGWGESVRILDSQSFGASRSFLLDDFQARPGAGTWSAGDNAVVLRPGRHAWQIGPVIGTPRHAAGLLGRAIDAAPGPVIIDLLAAGEDLAHDLTQRGFTPRRGFCRMALGRDTLPGNPMRLLAAAGPEFG